MKRKIQIAFWSVVGALAVAALAVAALFYDRRRVLEGERKMRADEFKAKVAKLKADEAAHKAKTEAAVAVIKEEAKQEAARDSVDAANDLIASLRNGEGR